MRKIFIAIMLTLPLLLLSATLTVSLDGTQQYTSIQTAINACSDGDVVLVYPGRYVENLDTSGRNITLASLYLNNPLQTYIDNTIVDGNQETCVRIENREQVTINGFTFVNNEQNVYPIENRCGAINVVYPDTHLSIYNCIIRDCTAVDAAGIGISLWASIYLSNVTIINNWALCSGGGIGFYGGTDLEFDESHPSSIYNNFSAKGMDIFIDAYRQDPTPSFNIHLTMGSIIMDQPDGYFIGKINANVNVDIQQAYLTQTDCDIYVSPDGSDENSGLTTDNPLKTIAFAMQKIKSSPEGPHTLHLAAGTYSYSQNHQMLPFSIKSDVRLEGSGTETTIIDCELSTAFIQGCGVGNFLISGIRFINSRTIYCSPLKLAYCYDFQLSNFDISNCSGSLESGILLAYCSDAIINIITIGQISINHDVSGLFLFECDNIYINKVLLYEQHILTADYSNLGITIFDSDVVFRNSILANNTAVDAFLFSYQNVYANYTDYNLDMSNVLFMNNTVSNVGWVYCPIYMQNRFQPIQVNNVTIANNTTNTTLTRIFAYADIKNLISYNPGSPGELYLRNNLSTVGVQAEVSISNSLFRSNSVNADLPNLVTFNECISGSNPLFLGTTTDTLSVTQPEYYYLSEGSPCINTGVADTTGMNLPLTDLAGNQRVWDGRIDMGCYEYGAPVSSEDPELPVPVNGINLSLYPNPVYANGSKGSYGFIEFTLPKKAKEPPLVEIYNLKGQRVRSLTISQSYNDLVRKAGFSKEVNTGGEFYSTVFDCKDMNSRPLATGIYLIRVKADGRQKTAKLTILR